ncbi:helix-turn-helix domain-containing protein [Streptomyces sp. CA-132043]|uniref:GbsR/MarR family transcriptional regulator n=1 Tax=Streptomyces sp. CA-132043 TaxID=3240048 RepID=UPI003D8E2A97
MPGGRLTQQERQQIALGLADGLAYAEIARGLDRPTSTITREVMRNGGPTAYRADLAHRATERRAHRRRRATPRDAETPPQAHGRDAEAVREYEEVFTTVLMASGLPKMMARVLSCLTITDAGSLTASELVQRLQVSPASVSKAIAYLDSQGLIRRERDASRRERYVVDDDVWYQSMMASARATAHLVDIARQGVGVLGADTPAAARLENIARFNDFVSESIARAAEQAREILHTKPETPPGSSDGTAEPRGDRG